MRTNKELIQRWLDSEIIKPGNYVFQNSFKVPKMPQRVSMSGEFDLDHLVRIVKAEVFMDISKNIYGKIYYTSQARVVPTGAYSEVIPHIPQDITEDVKRALTDYLQAFKKEIFK